MAQLRGNLWGAVSDFGLEAGARRFDGAAVLMLKPGADDYLSARASVQLTQELVFGLSPILSCEHLINRSNVKLYDYSATDCGVRLTRGF